MRTTINIDDGLPIQAKQFAAGQHTSLTRLFEEGLSLRLQTSQAVTTTKVDALCRFMPDEECHSGCLDCCRCIKQPPASGGQLLFSG